MTSLAVLGLNIPSMLLSQALAVRNRTRSKNSSKVQSSTEVQEETTLKRRSAKLYLVVLLVLHFCIFKSVFVGFEEIFMILMNSEV